MKTPDEIARAWIVAFNRHDVDALVGIHDPEAVHVSPKLRSLRPETRGQIRGREALRLWWKDAFDRLPELHYELKAVTAGANRVFIEYDRINSGEPPLPVAEVFELRGGRIVASAVYHG